jgi:uncharacterized protein (DUF1330 family)
VALPLGRFAMPVYMIIEIEIRNPELYSGYVEAVPQVVETYGGRYLVRGGQVTPLSGDWNPERVIVIEFESAEQLQRCFTSPEYLQIAPLREQSTVSRSIIVEGHAAPMVTLESGQ